MTSARRFTGAMPSTTPPTCERCLGGGSRGLSNSRPKGPSRSQPRLSLIGEPTMTNSYPFSVSGEEFKDKRVLVTGGTKGVGEAIVRRFQLSGALVATTARAPSLRGQAANLFVQADLATVGGVNSVAERIRQDWGGLDVLVNNVGGTDTKPGGFRSAQGRRLARDAGAQPDGGRPTRPRLHSRHDRTQIGSGSPHLLDRAPSAVLKFDVGLCSGQGSSKHLQ